MTQLMPYALPPLAQVGIVVADLQRAAADYERRWGVTTEQVQDMALDDARLHGEQAATSARYGFISTGASQIELIQPLGAPSPYTEFLEANGGDGIHHLAYIVDGIDPFLEHLREAGEHVDVDFTTSFTFPGLGSGRFVYVDGLMHGPVTELTEITAVPSASVLQRETAS
jgi:catechol 2,3-dioxygenase-like lactoylglutathione lyase family enzyme